MCYVNKFEYVIYRFYFTLLNVFKIFSLSDRFMISPSIFYLTAQVEIETEGTWTVLFLLFTGIKHLTTKFHCHAKWDGLLVTLGTTKQRNRLLLKISVGSHLLHWRRLQIRAINDQQGRQCTYNVNIQARSCNRGCSGQAVRITYCVCVCTVALGI